MKKKQIKVKKISKYCTLLQNETIKEELRQALKGYKIKNINNLNDKYLWQLSHRNNYNATLTIKKDTLEVLKKETLLAEKIKITEQPLLLHTKVEKKPNGIIISCCTKYLSTPMFPKKDSELVELIERRYIITKETIEKLYKTNFDNIELLKCLDLDSNVDLEDFCILKTEFLTHINYHWQNELNHCSTKTYLNGNDISGMYASVRGKKRLYRIYDLYNGIINARNTQDVLTISSGNIRPESFDLRYSLGITELEEKLIGTSSLYMSAEEKEKLKNKLVAEPRCVVKSKKRLIIH